MDNTNQKEKCRPNELLEANPLVTKIRSFKSYWQTKKAVKKGDPIHDYTRNQLMESRFLGPWSFNLYESFLASMPTAIIFKVATYFMTTSDSISKVSQVESWLKPVFITLTLTIMANAVAKGSLKLEDITQKKISRAKYAYLYIDGAYGLTAQALLILGFTLQTYISHGYFNLSIIKFATYAFIGYGIIYQWYILMYIAPQRLFSINGYNDIPDHKKDAPPNSAPYKRFGKTVVHRGLGTISLLLVVYYIILYASKLIAA